MNNKSKNLERKILVVDDERLLRLTVCAVLKKAGYEAIAASTVDEAVSLLNQHPHEFYAIISDVMMGGMDGFVFRDIVRGIDTHLPIFFMTALDPEEGSGFLMKILRDPLSYYVPKAVGFEVLLNRLKRVVVARRIEQFVENQVEEQRRQLEIAAHVQSSMLPVRAMMDERRFYVTMWHPRESVSGDMYEVLPLSGGATLFVLGDIQGHGTNAALVMMAVQSFLRQLVGEHVHERREVLPDAVANSLQGFFIRNFADVSYMTATICILRPAEEGGGRPDSLSYIPCGTGDVTVIDTNKKRKIDVNPDHRGGLPIGLFPDTVYSRADIVTAELPPGAVCVSVTDGLAELSRDSAGVEAVPEEVLDNIGMDVAVDSLGNGSIMSAPYKFISACRALGYDKFHDDVTTLIFGIPLRGGEIYEATTALSPSLVDEAAQAMGAWCAEKGWPEELSQRIQLVLEESLMNVYDHGFSNMQRRRDVVSLRLRKRGDRLAELTVWDCGTRPGSMKVAAGDAATAFAQINKGMGSHGRGRLIMRKLSVGIERYVFETLNETEYLIPWEMEENNFGG